MERSQDVGSDPEQEREEEQADFGDTPPDETVNAGQDRETDVEDEQPRR